MPSKLSRRKLDGGQCGVGGYCPNCKLSREERRVVEAAIDVYCHPEFDEGTGWILGSKRIGVEQAIAINAKLWAACHALSRKRATSRKQAKQRKPQSRICGILGGLR